MNARELTEKFVSELPFPVSDKNVVILKLRLETLLTEFGKEAADIAYEHQVTQCSKHIEEAIAAERESCAKVCEHYGLEKQANQIRTREKGQ